MEYDPNRTARIALVSYTDGAKRYVLAPDKLAVGDKIVAGPGADIKVGNSLPLKNIPLGTVIHNIELRPGQGGEARAQRRGAGPARGQGRRAMPRSSCPPARSG